MIGLQNDVQFFGTLSIFTLASCVSHFSPSLIFSCFRTIFLTLSDFVHLLSVTQTSFNYFLPGPPALRFKIEVQPGATINNSQLSQNSQFIFSIFSRRTEIGVGDKNRQHPHTHIAPNITWKSGWRRAENCCSAAETVTAADVASSCSSSACSLEAPLDSGWLVVDREV